MAVKRATDAALAADGMRVLVERRWPPGKRRDDLAVDLWLREAGPSEGLRREYANGAHDWERFVARYRAEMARRGDLLRLLRELARRGRVTLLYSTRDPARNSAAALRRILDELA